MKCICFNWMEYSLVFVDYLTNMYLDLPSVDSIQSRYFIINVSLSFWLKFLLSFNNTAAAAIDNYVRGSNHIIRFSLDNQAILLFFYSFILFHLLSKKLCSNYLT